MDLMTTTRRSADARRSRPVSDRLPAGHAELFAPRCQRRDPWRLMPERALRTPHFGTTRARGNALRR